jgi:hypothetical protein
LVAKKFFPNLKSSKITQYASLIVLKKAIPLEEVLADLKEKDPLVEMKGKANGILKIKNI